METGKTANSLIILSKMCSLFTTNGNPFSVNQSLSPLHANLRIKCVFEVCLTLAILEMNGTLSANHTQRNYGSDEHFALRLVNIVLVRLVAVMEISNMAAVTSGIVSEIYRHGNRFVLTQTTLARLTITDCWTVLSKIRPISVRVFQSCNHPSQLNEKLELI